MKSRSARVGMVLLAVLGVGIAFHFREVPPVSKNPSAPQVTETTPLVNAMPPVRVTRSHPQSLPSVPTSDPTFAKFCDQVLAKLPTLNSVRPRSDSESHHTPSDVIESGQLLGEIAERLAAQPSLKAQSLDFYRQCAERPNLLLSTRALCFAHLRSTARELGRDVSVESVPQTIRDLAERVPVSD